MDETDKLAECPWCRSVPTAIGHYYQVFHLPKCFLAEGDKGPTRRLIHAGKVEAWNTRAVAAPPGIAPCRNCNHALVHDAPAGAIADGCPHEGCNCGYYEPSPVAATVDAETDLDRAEATFDAQVLIATWQLTKARAFAAHTEEAGEVCRRDCEGCNDPVGQVIAELRACRSAPSPSSEAIRVAAAEIVEMFKGWMSLEQRINRVAAILSKHLGSAAVPVDTSTDAWHEWFDRLGEKASAEVINATADLVTNERLAALSASGVLPTSTEDGK